MFAGVSHDALLVAGGANFPDRKPWEGGTKAWYDTVFVLESKTATWKVAGQLPRPLAYGVSASFGDALLAVGGADSKQHYAEAQLLRWNGEQLKIAPLPNLPQPLAYNCGALIGTKLYISGGQPSPDAPPVKSLYRLDLASKSPKWEILPECPGPGRMLAAIASYEDTLWIIGGVELVKNEQGQLQRKYLDTVYRYDEKRGWSEMAALPTPAAAAPSPTPLTKSGFTLLGGDDGAQVGQDPLKHRGFNEKIMEYDVAKNSWREVGKLSSPRVTTPCVSWQGLYVVPSGEIKPGRRTPTMFIVDIARRSTGP
jgi:N-acetylneuraminic acid mutarotase